MQLGVAHNPHPRSVGVALLAATLALFVGCSSGTETARPGATTRVPVPAAAERYDSRVIAPISPVDPHVAAAVAGAAPLTEPDERLHRLAAIVDAHHRANGDLPTSSRVTWLAERLGFPFPTPHVLVYAQSRKEGLADEVALRVVSAQADGLYRLFGVSVSEHSGLHRAVVVLSGRAVEFQPVPRETRDAIQLSGQVLPPFADPIVIVQHPNGTVDRGEPTEGQAFSQRVDFNARGEYRLEVVATGPIGIAVLANFPVYVGVPAPSEPPAEHTPQGVVDVATFTAQLETLINESRQQAGLSALARSADLDGVAVRHSVDMVRAGFVGHRSASTGEAVDRVARSGVVTDVVLENIARGYSAREAHDGLMRSAGHRGNILSDDVTHIGLGVATEPDAGSTAYLVTQVFVRFAPDVDPAEARAEIIRELNTLRERERVSPLEEEENLARVAQQAADRFLAEPSVQSQEVVDDAARELRQFGLIFRRVRPVLAVARDPDEVLSIETLHAGDARFIGVGVAQGHREGVPPGNLVIVLISATPQRR